ncbi:MAG: metal-dependent hydrolase [Candidatus Edwardsbacteria bacterium]
MRTPHPRFIFGRETEIEKIKKLIDDEVTFLLFAETGVGKTHLIRHTVKPFLDGKSEKIFGIDRDGKLNGRCYYDISSLRMTESRKVFNNLERYLTTTYNIPVLPENMRAGLDAGGWTIRIKQILKTIRYNNQSFYLIYDQMETMNPSLVNIFREWLQYALFIFATTPTRYPQRLENFYQEIGYQKVIACPLTTKEAIDFYDAYCVQIGLTREKIGDKLYQFARTKILSQIFGVPQAIVAMIVRLKHLSPLNKVNIRTIENHESGVLERDITMAIFILIFCFVAMRFLTMRTFERWIYAVFAILSMGGMYSYRLVGRRFTLKEENELPINRAESQILFPLRRFYILIHIIASILLLNVLLSTFLIKTTLPAILICGFFSILPDIDIETSTISRVVKWSSGQVIKCLNFIGLHSTTLPLYHLSTAPSWLESHWGHRTYCHSVWAVLFTAIMTLPLSLTDWRLTFGAVCGVLGHIFYDALSPSGVKLCYPARHSYVCPGPKSMRIPNGSKRELIFASCFLLPASCFFFYIASIGWGRVYLNLTGDPNALAREVARYINNNNVIVSINGMWRVSLRPAVQERFNVVAVMGDEMFAEQNGKLYRLSPNFLFSAISVSKGKIEVGDKVSTSARTIEIKEKSFDEFYEQIPTNSVVSGRISGVAYETALGKFAPREAVEEFSAVQMLPSGKDKVEIVLAYATNEYLKQLLGEGVWIDWGVLTIATRRRNT